MTLTLRRSRRTDEAPGEDATASAPAAPVAPPLRRPDGVLPRVNLLPPEIAERKAARRAQGVAAGTVVLAVAAAAGLAVLASASVADASAEVAEATAEQAAVQAQIADFTELRATQASLDAATSQLATAMGPEVQWSTYLNDLALSIPPNVWLSSLTVTRSDAAGGAGSSDVAPTDPAATAGLAADPGIGIIAFEGHAMEHDDVAAWLDSFTGQPAYANAYFSLSEEEEIGSTLVVAFASTATLTTEALSGRYLPEGQ